MIRHCLAYVDSAVAEAFATPPVDINVVPQAPRDQAGPALATLVRDDNDLIVNGTRQRHRLSLGVAGYCARRACCPLIIVPPPSMVGRASTGKLTRSLRRELESSHVGR